MKTNTVYFYPGRPCLKVHNDEGDELSLTSTPITSGVHCYTSLAVFPKGGNRMAGDEQLYVSPEDLLRTLAKHLGYTVSRKRAKP